MIKTLFFLVPRKLSIPCVRSSPPRARRTTPNGASCLKIGRWISPESSSACADLPFTGWDRTGRGRRRRRRRRGPPPFFGSFGVCRAHVCRKYANRRAPDRSTPDVSRPCESDAGIRVCRPRPCLLCAHRFSADSVGVDAGRLARPRPYARARCGSGKGKNVNARYGNYQMRMTSCIEMIKYNSLRGSVVRKQHNVA